MVESWVDVVGADGVDLSVFVSCVLLSPLRTLDLTPSSCMSAASRRHEVALLNGSWLLNAPYAPCPPG